MPLRKWKPIFDAKAQELYPATDPSHDILHIRRVVKTALELADKEGADINVVLPAAYFHDFVNVPKNDPRRKEASRLSADAAVEYLKSVDYPAEYLPAIHHAIAAHSFSANIPAETLEAKVVQDADRLDGLGAVGIARTFTTGALMGSVSYYHETDMMAENRDLDDKRHTVDHFFVKLFRTAETLHTDAAKAEGQRRVAFMRGYLEQLKQEAA
ncbi:MAG: HD domain-containing protein [Alphaproteobacteria bacterium]|nr:HD domain-containing protein [Alphaproteobacteria bacterium]